MYNNNSYSREYKCCDQSGLATAPVQRDETGAERRTQGWAGLLSDGVDGALGLPPILPPILSDTALSTSRQVRLEQSIQSQFLSLQYVAK